MKVSIGWGVMWRLDNRPAATMSGWAVPGRNVGFLSWARNGTYRMRAACAVVLVLITAQIPGACGRDVRRDPVTNRIRILYIGDAWGPTPYTYMMEEPSFTGTPIPATYAHIGTYNDRQLRQFMRVYMPRTFDDLTTSYDLIILSDTNRGLYRADQLEWFKRGVEKTGMGLMMVGGIEAFGGKGYPTWKGSSVEEALPVECVDGKTYEISFKVVANYPDDPFVRSLPWNTMPPFGGMNVVEPKEGAKILLQMAAEPKHPVLVYWQYGEGSGLAHTPDWTPAWGTSVMYDWRFYPDYVVNMNFLNAGAKIPEDLDLMHDIRTRFHNYFTRRALAISLMEFVEKFGARISPAERSLVEIGLVERNAEQLYLEQAYPDALSRLQETEEMFRSLSDQLMALKERALLWTYVVEWFAVTATAMICGALLWTLMIRRRLYREVKVTRAR